MFAVFWGGFGGYVGVCLEGVWKVFGGVLGRLLGIISPTKII